MISKISSLEKKEIYQNNEIFARYLILILKYLFGEQKSE